MATHLVDSGCSAVRWDSRFGGGSPQRPCVPSTHIERLNHSIGLAVENGTRLHISLGRGNLISTRGASALAGLAMLRRLAERTSVSDRPPIATSGDASLAILSQDTLQSGYRAAGVEEQYRPTTGRLTGLSPFSYAAGAMPVESDEEVSANIFIGDFGAEFALLADAAERKNSDLIAASDNLSAQAVYYACCAGSVDRGRIVRSRRLCGSGRGA